MKTIRGHGPVMTDKRQFNAEEWSTVVEGPALAGLAVVKADRGGTLRESMSIARAYSEALKEGVAELVQEVVNSAPSIDARALQDRGGDVAGYADERLAEACAIVERVADASELEDYRRLVLDVADTVARAHKEGGFLGIGGTAVSDKERAALDRIARAVGMAGH